MTTEKGRLNGLDLFSGVGGNTLGLQQYIKTIAYCETERYPQSVLLSRGLSPIWDDIRTLKGSMFDIPIDIIFGGFPCQDISIAGKGKGLAGKHSGLFYELCRLVEEIQPTFVFLENVPAIRTRALREVIRALTDIRYDCRWTCISAKEIGANHIRKRWFLLAHTNSQPLRVVQQRVPGGRQDGVQTKGEAPSGGNGQNVADTQGVGRSQAHQDLRGGFERSRKEGGATRFTQCSINIKGKNSNIPGEEWWETEPDVGRVVNGSALRVDRIKCLGNAVVPIQAKVAFERLLGVEHG